MVDLVVDKTPGSKLALTNAIFVSKPSFAQLCETHGLSADDADAKAFGVLCEVRGQVFSARPFAGVEDTSCCFNSTQRTDLRLAMRDPIAVRPFSPPSDHFVLESITFELAYLKPADNGSMREVDVEALAADVKEQWVRQVFGRGQRALFRSSAVQGRPYVVLRCTELQTISLRGAMTGEGGDSAERGQIMPKTGIFFTKKEGQKMQLSDAAGGGSETGNWMKELDFLSMGIGGLNKEFEVIFRRAFQSRIFPASFLKEMGINHVRGMLLYGPPGCGKTLIARKISQALKARPPKIVNGPSILDKFVGGSEAKIRELFEDAEAEQEECGEASELHVIIFDEIDAICKKRGRCVAWHCGVASGESRSAHSPPARRGHCHGRARRTPLASARSLRCVRSFVRPPSPPISLANN